MQAKKNLQAALLGWCPLVLCLRAGPSRSKKGTSGKVDSSNKFPRKDLKDEFLLVPFSGLVGRLPVTTGYQPYRHKCGTCLIVA